MGVGTLASASQTARNALPTNPLDAVCTGYSSRRIRENQSVSGMKVMP